MNKDTEALSGSERRQALEAIQAAVSKHSKQAASALLALTRALAQLKGAADAALPRLRAFAKEMENKHTVDAKKSWQHFQGRWE